MIQVFSGLTISGVGKSCVLKRLTENVFKQDHDVTVGVEFGSFLIKIEDHTLKLQIWDTAGQESFRSITKIFYRNSHAVILTYAVDKAPTLESLINWLQEVRLQCSDDVMLILVGNKSDLEGNREINSEEALKFKQEHNILYWVETSAKSGENVERLFIDVAKFLYDKYKDKLHDMMSEDAPRRLSSTDSRDSFESGGRPSFGRKKKKPRKKTCNC